ncbi:unnamed protein product, partial [marine sediment metagenome]
MFECGVPEEGLIQLHDPVEIATVRPKSRERTNPCPGKKIEISRALNVDLAQEIGGILCHYEVGEKILEVTYFDLGEESSEIGLSNSSFTEESSVIDILDNALTEEIHEMGDTRPREELDGSADMSDDELPEDPNGADILDDALSEKLQCADVSYDSLAEEVEGNAQSY